MLVLPEIRVKFINTACSEVALYGFVLRFRENFPRGRVKTTDLFITQVGVRLLISWWFDSNFSEFNTLIKNKKDASDKYFFVTNNGRWTGFVDKNILKNVSLKKWERNFVGDFKKPIDSFESVSYNDKLWRTIERLEETNEGFLLVLNAADIPLGIIDRSKIGNFVLNKLGFNLPSDIVNKFNFKNHYPLGIELPRIINSMKQKGDL